MRLRYFLLLLVCLAVVATVAVACGSGDEGALPAGAELAPADAALFIAIDTDFESDQWQNAGAILDKFPDGDKLRSMILDELSDEGIDLDEDVKPAVGPQVNVVWLDAADEESFVGLTQPKDADKLRALLEKGDEEFVYREVEGWTAFATDEKYFDALEQGRAAGTLDEDDRFADAMGRVAEDALFRLYFNGPVAAPALEESFGSELGFENLVPGGEVPWVSVSVSADDEGGRFDGAAGFEGDPAGFVGESYEAALPDVVPAGALAYISFKDLEGQLSRFRDLLAESDPDFERDIGRLESQIGVSLEEDIGPLFAGEGAFYVRQGLFIPEITLLLEVDDEANAMGVLDDLVEGVRTYVPFGPPQTVQIEGVEARQIDIEPPVSLYYAAFDGHLAITSQRAGIAALQAEGDRLADDDNFQQALSDAGVPDETAGFAYVNLRDIITYVVGLVGAAEDVPPEVGRNLEPLRDLVFYSTRDGNVVEFSGLLSVD